MTSKLNLSSLATCTLGASLTILISGLPRAQAATLITFETQAVGPFSTPLLTDGFELTGVSFISSGADFCTPECPENGTNYANILADVGMQTKLRLTAIHDQTFSFLQFDGAEVEADEPRDEFTTGSDFWAETIDVKGFLADGSTVMTSFTLDKVQDGSGPENDFQTFVLSDNFTNLIALELMGNGNNLASWFSIDNLLLELSDRPDPEAVPEPTVLAGLIFLGGLGLFPRRQA